ncbi:TetR/AcrR family transcriptional regulator [Streptosporangium sp. NBC_01755]|uniref:TetR/AcrR family transcriptional regulator n=1 Tax=unclassified Streptosporangium TaxID=2632669 RepID=UPI002DDBAF16|nr:MULTISPECIES: TetR/AcrR family transcriptional regulator [unclassified Streptosporangium]WSA29416.1 TetR/AcrR family transcriptional regulator [Streptosporangium sp. NBC_01810]WSC99140.1 TetR/AcrR family transcriptional regulator [Streptosporangium sp. NBC_01755]
MARTASRGGPRGTYSPAETRRALLASALKLFEVGGYHATSVEDIVKEANLTKGALYHHFSGKEEILQQIQEEYIDDRLRNCRRILESFEGPTERLRQLILESLVVIDRFRAHVTVFTLERRFLTEDRFAEIKKKRDELDAMYESVIRQGVEEGVFNPSLQPRIAGFGVLGMLTSAYDWYRPDGLPAVSEVADQLSELVLEGLTSSPSRASSSR